MAEEREGYRAVHVWLPRETLRRIDHMAIDADTDRSSMVRRLIERGLEANR